MDAFRFRFTTTADLTLSQLAYIFTPPGLSSFQALPNDLPKRLTKTKLKAKFLEIAADLNIDALGPAAKFLPALFENYTSYCKIDEGDDPYSWWEDKAEEEITITQVNGGAPFQPSPLS